MAEKRKPLLPACPKVRAGPTEEETLRAMAREGLNARLEAKGRRTPRPASVYEERLEYELGVIQKMGFPGYFLIVCDFIQWAKAHGIPVGPGRGSGAGSRRRLGADASPTSTRCATACCSSASSTPNACRCRTSTSTSARTGATR